MASRFLTALILLFFTISGFSQTFTPCLKAIEFSEKPKGTKKVSSIYKALEDPSKVYHLKIYFNDSELNRLDSFFNHANQFLNLRKLELIHVGVNRKKENIPDSFYQDLLELEMLVFWVEEELQMKGVSKLKKLKYIEVNSSSTKQIPEELYKVNSLECMQFCYTEIKMRSSNIGSLENLKYLNLVNNTIDGFPKNLLFIPKLEYLDISNDAQADDLIHCGENKIDSIPIKLLEMPHLQEIGIRGLNFSDEFFIKNLPKMNIDKKQYYFVDYPNVKVTYR